MQSISPLEKAFIHTIQHYKLDDETTEKTFNDAMSTIRSLKKAKIKCPKCGTKNDINNITLYQTHYYVLPSGCSLGDYWLPGECQFNCNCCKTVNRLLKEETKHKIELCKPYFKEVIETYGKEQNPTYNKEWVNNFSDIT